MRTGLISLVVSLACIAGWAPPLQAGGREADSFVLARTSFPATARHDVPAVVRVELRSDQTLRIAVELYGDHEAGLYQPATRTLHRVRRLAPAAFEDLLLDVEVLSTAETRRVFPLCAFEPPPLGMHGELDVLRDYDVDEDAFLGDVERVLQRWGCSVRIFLADPNDAQLASEFQAKVGIVATQMLGRLLIETGLRGGAPCDQR